MKKRLNKVFAFLLSAVMLLGTAGISALASEVADNAGVLMFLAYGGENADGSWNMCWANEASADGTIQATTAELVEAGQQVTIGLTFPQEVAHTYYMAPVIVAEGVSSVDYTIDSITFDGEDVLSQADLSIGEDEWWYESTGEYTDTQAIRLKGGYNDWAEQAFTESPVGFKEVMYTITVNSIEYGVAPAAEDGAAEAVLSEESYPAYLAFGGNSTEGEWDYFYYDDAQFTEGVEAVTGELKNGETTTLSLTFPGEVSYTYFVAPAFIVDDPASISPTSTFDVKVSIDGTEVATDLTVGVSCWAEDTGNNAGNCVRICGGYNEWGDKYIAEAPAGFTTISFEITPTIYVGGTATESGEDETADAAGSVDLNGTYNAYLGLQTPVYSFRNAFDDAAYGRDTEFFNQMTGWDNNDPIKKDGTFTDAVIEGNGTYTVSANGLALDGEFDSQDHFNLIFISTDIPNTGEITISDIKLVVNGSTVSINPIVSPDSPNYLNMLIQNIWNEDVAEIGYYAVPPTDVSVTFTVSGFAYDNPNATVAEETEAVQEPAATEAAADTAADTTADTATESGSNTTTIVVVVVVIVVIVAIVAVVIVSKKKKESK